MTPYIWTLENWLEHTTDIGCIVLYLTHKEYKLLLAYKTDELLLSAITLEEQFIYILLVLEAEGR